MESKTDPADLYQISLLIDQLRHDDPQMRINATKNLHKIGSLLFFFFLFLSLSFFTLLLLLLINLIYIAQALGPERTRDELIPFLNG